MHFVKQFLQNTQNQKNLHKIKDFAPRLRIHVVVYITDGWEVLPTKINDVVTELTALLVIQRF